MHALLAYSWLPDSQEREKNEGALSDDPDEREKIQYYVIRSYANTRQGIQIYQLSSIEFLREDLIAFEKKREERKNTLQ